MLCTRCSPALTHRSGGRHRDEVDAALAEFDRPDGFVGPCQLLVAAGTRGAFRISHSKSELPYWTATARLRR